eukprot:875126-Rhodomonas_salina.1
MVCVTLPIRNRPRVHRTVGGSHSLPLLVQRNQEPIDGRDRCALEPHSEQRGLALLAQLGQHAKNGAVTQKIARERDAGVLRLDAALAEHDLWSAS